MTLATRTEKLEAFGRLLDIMDDLREKCPWDRKQTFESLRLLSIEEVYELADELLKGNREGIAEEVGDVMLHMVFYALLGQEEGAFDIASIIHTECEKLISRHPHIYGDVEVADEEEVKRNWEQLKLKEKGKTTVLGGVPRGLPALVKAYRMQEKTAQFGFEWEHVEEVFTKVEEELGELQEAIAEKQGHERVEEEFGDLLFSLVNYGRFLKVDPETALERTNQKFKRRFEHIESHAQKPLSDMTLAEMDELWEEAKRLERQ
ncbi:MAG: nucleoside triphosphate pyrophosphohydrolase [Saprospiraceae bacterium]